MADRGEKEAQMSIGLFEVRCPVCGVEMASDGGGRRACPACSQSYLDRFGYLIPVDQPDGEREPAPATDHLLGRPRVGEARFG
jgi:tRNA(Ile2) C34 agmatinyltransferase TiaS